MTHFDSLYFKHAGHTWELVRYGGGQGRIYHLLTEQIAVEGAERATPQSIKASLEGWLRDHARRVYAEGSEGR